MMLSERDFLNYISCPLRYKLESSNHNTKRSTYNTLLHDVANLYVNRVGSVDYLGDFDHEKFIKKNWDKTCLENQHLITDKQCINGWGYLYRLSEFLRLPNIKVLDSNITYTIEPPGLGYGLTGTLDPIIKQGDFYTTLIISFSDKLPESYVMDMNLKHTIDSYALNQLIPNVNHVTTYHSFKSGAEKDTLRFKDHHERLEHILEVVGKSIEQDLIYPRHSYSCSTCNFRGLCSQWKGDKKNDK